MRRTYRCLAPRITYEFGDARLRAKVLDEHPNCEAGKVIVTSALASIDFDKRVAVTQNSIYVW